MIIFILFMLSFKKVLGLIKNAVIIVAASALFPIIANRFLGLPVPSDGETIFSFVVLGLGVYFLYILASSVYKVLSYFEKSGKRLPKIEMKHEKENKELPERLTEKKTERAKPFVVGNKKKRKTWERDFASLEEKRTEKVPARQQKRKRKRKAKLEKIRVIGGEQ